MKFYGEAHVKWNEKVKELPSSNKYENRNFEAKQIYFNYVMIAFGKGENNIRKLCCRFVLSTIQWDTPQANKIFLYKVKAV